MDIAGYLEQVRRAYESGDATEHSYRPALQSLFQSIDPKLTVINEPKRGDAGMVDFMFKRGDVPFGWAEAKDIDKDVIKLKGYSIEQRKRYEAAYPNLIYTNGVDFEFIRDGEQVHLVTIADFMGPLGGLQPRPEHFAELERHLRLFAEQKPISIRSAPALATMMAAKAEIIKEEIEIALRDDPDFRSGLGGQYKSFKANLLPALEPDEFADIYAETITYGMFAARFHDTDLNTFSRQEAMEDLPASNPFLKGLFEYIAGPQLPKRLEYIVDDLVQVMRASDPHSLFRDFGKFTARNDPFVHFYEDFLAAYNPKKRKARGVWYTPEPVVDFIVRAVDDVLKTEFGLADGLADTSKVTVDWDTGQNDNRGRPVTIKKEVHKVQILDPATGTGTFLAKAVQLIADRVKTRAPGKWSNYVEEDLLPRLHGFELLMASYAMCHMKLDMMLDQTGYKPSAKPPRLSVWLTNSLEPAEREIRDLFFQPLAEEARGASEVKRQMPIMCVIGNPPYSVSSANQGDWIQSLMATYKAGLTDANIQPLSDDYVKFLRYAHYLIEKNGSGVMAMVTNHSFINGVIHRTMRNSLMQSFDRIAILDLHGNANKLERSPDGSPDQNVFDILQGVSVLVAVKTGKGARASVEHGELWGPRASKYAALFSTDLHSGTFGELEPNAPLWLFSPVDETSRSAYNEGFALASLMPLHSGGVQTKRDALFVGYDQREVADRIVTLLSGRLAASFVKEFEVQDSSSYRLTQKISRASFESELIVPFNYRPLDRRFVYYDKDLIGRPFYQTGRHMIVENNISLALPRQSRRFNGALVASGVSGQKCFDDYDINLIFPLYVYPAEGERRISGAVRKPNLDPKLHTAICKAAGIDPADQAGPDDDFRTATGEARPSEVKVFDYIYGVLHSPAYRETFAEFLKIDFPRIPYPPSPEVFRHVAEKGEQLRRLHLMEPQAIGDAPYPYLGEGDDIVAGGHPKFEGSKVHINKDQYFEAVPELAWSFYIGGYQPAQKWLKDRRGRALSWDDIGHYQKIVKILAETDRIMKEIELPLD